MGEKLKMWPQRWLRISWLISDGDPLDASDASQQDVDEDEERERNNERVDEDDKDADNGSDDGLDPNAKVDDLS